MLKWRKNLLINAMACAVLYYSLLLPTTVSAGFAFESIAYAGDLIPGPPSDIALVRFNAPALNELGQVAFQASIGVDGVRIGEADDAVFFGDSEGIEFIAQSGMQVGNAEDGSAFAGISHPTPLINDTGQVTFRGTAVLENVSLGQSIRDVIYTGTTSALNVVAREGQTAPGPPGIGGFIRFFEPAFNNAGQSAFIADLPADFTGNAIVVAEADGGLASAALSNQQAPGTPDGVIISSMTSPVLNGQGQVAFGASLAGSGVDTSNQFAVFTGQPGSLNLIARRGDQVSGQAPGVNYGFPENPVINDAGQVAFYSSFTASDMGDPAGRALFAVDGDTYRVAARSGDQAPGAPEGVTFRDLLSSSAVLNNSGRTAFIADLAGPGVDGANNLALFAEGAKGLSLIAREGDQVSHSPDGVRLAGISDFAFNDQGQVIFLARLSGLNVNFGNDTAVFVADDSGVLEVVARSGDIFDVSDDPSITDLRTISAISVALNSGGSDGRSTGFNNMGQLALALSFTDATSGIFITTIPEPESALVAAFLLATLSRLRSRRPMLNP